MIQEMEKKVRVPGKEDPNHSHILYLEDRGSVTCFGHTDETIIELVQRYYEGKYNIVCKVEDKAGNVIYSTRDNALRKAAKDIGLSPETCEELLRALNNPLDPGTQYLRDAYNETAQKRAAYGL